MKEHPILFSGHMLRAILEGRKTQTRRVIKTSAPKGRPQFTFGPSLSEDALRKCKPMRRGKYEYIGAAPDIENQLRCPFGMSGDRLWVREAFSVSGDDQPVVFYKATDHADHAPWKPSIHMRRWASRLTLEITWIRIQRVQEITDQDAIAEGVAAFKFSSLWDSINAKRGFGWAVNPWVWAITFRRVEP